MVSRISNATPFNAKISSKAFSSSSHPFLLATVSNWNLNTVKDELPSKQGGFISHWFRSLFLKVVDLFLHHYEFSKTFFSKTFTFVSTIFSKSFTVVTTVFSKCETLSSTAVTLFLTDLCISCSFHDIATSSYSIFYKITVCSF